MNKLDYGNFDITNADIAFSSTNGYSDPASEIETRKQLSYPLKELKTFINNTVSEDENANAIQLVVTSDGLKYRDEVGGDLNDVGGASIDSVYPVGSVYISVNSANPSTVFPDTTWVQISNASLNNGTKFESLWTNPNPTSAFSAQTVSLDLTNYDLIFICHYGSVATGPNPQQVVTAGIKSYGYAWMETGGLGSPRRKASISDSGVTFESGFYNGETNNSHCIPQKIYGLKTTDNVTVYVFKRTA